jgi:Chromo (CHRromatin Organisation MOdifier) domain
LSGEDIEGEFYEQEFQKVIKTDDMYEVEKVIKTRKQHGKVEYYVKWKGYTDKFNSWTSDVFR